MRRSRRVIWWSAYALGAATVLGGLAWTTARVLRLEREEAEARAANDRQETLRLALWRMDSWIAPRLARESARAWYEYEPYHPQTLAFNRLLEPIAEGEIILPSPLLGLESDLFPLHFQWRPETGLTSPQVPPAVISDASVACGPVAPIAAHEELLARYAPLLDGLALGARLTEADERRPSDPPAPPVEVPQQWTKGGFVAQSVDPGDYRARSANTAMAQKAFVDEVQAQQSIALKQFESNRQHTRLDRNEGATPATQQLATNAMEDPQTERPPSPQIGPLVPLWLPGNSDVLVVARRVELGERVLLQGAIVDWDRLRESLLAQASDLLPGAALERDRSAAGTNGSLRLASLPVRLVPPDDPVIAPGQHPAGAGLWLVWIAALGAIGVTGLALHASIGAAVRTSRFASSVTHELRTPLTTFRLYSEMLADGAVREPTRMQEYFNTLRDESARLALLVENVLAWSRAEDGRSPAEPRTVAVEGLIGEIGPVLRRRCEEGRAAFEAVIDAPPEGRVRTDPDRVRQILFNLVDNACKYGGGSQESEQGEASRVRLIVAQDGSRLSLAIDDGGPGVPERLRRRVFRAFDRGERGPGDSVRGLGLGLAISTELARSLGGRIVCGRSSLGGARFALELPLAGPNA